MTLTNTRMEVAVSDAAIVAFHGVGLLAKGENVVPGTVVATISASGTREREQTTNRVDFTASSTVTDPDGIPGTGDESAAVMVVDTALPDTVWSGLGPAQTFSIVGSDLELRLFFGVIEVDVLCTPGALPVEFATTGSSTTTTTTTTAAPTTTTTAAPTTTAPGPPSPLPTTGPVRTAVMLVTGLVLLDLGYLAASSTRRVG